MFTEVQFSSAQFSLVQEHGPSWRLYFSTLCNGSGNKSLQKVVDVSKMCTSML